MAIDLPFEGRKVEGSQKYRGREINSLRNLVLLDLNLLIRDADKNV